MQEKFNEGQNLEEEVKSDLLFGEFCSDEELKNLSVNTKKSDEEFKEKREVVIIGERYEDPTAQKISEEKNSYKKKCLILSLFGLFFSVFYIGIIFSAISIGLCIPLIKRDKRSTLFKWAVVCNVCAVIIELTLIFGTIYFG